jgi:hypothetical protein
MSALVLCFFSFYPVSHLVGEAIGSHRYGRRQNALSAGHEQRAQHVPEEEAFLYGDQPIRSRCDILESSLFFIFHFFFLFLNSFSLFHFLSSFSSSYSLLAISSNTNNPQILLAWARSLSCQSDLEVVASKEGFFKLTAAEEKLRMCCDLMNPSREDADLVHGESRDLSLSQMNARRV